MIADLACQMRSGFGQVVRAFRNASDHRQPSLRTGQSLPCRGVTNMVGLVEAAISLS